MEKNKEDLTNQLKKTAFDFTISTAYYYINPKSINKIFRHISKTLKNKLRDPSDDMDMIDGFSD